VVFQGNANRTTVNNGTLVDWGLGTFSGQSLSATVNSGGFLFDVGPTAFDGSSTLNGGGMFVEFNATASATIVNSGSVLTLLGSGTGSSTETAGIINRGGIEVVSSGGLDIATLVRGQEFVQAAGSARSADVLAGGIQSVLAGGVVANTFIDGGTVEMTSGSLVGNIPLSFSADTGGVLILDFSQGFTGTIAGFASPPGVTEFIDLKDIQFGAGTTVKFTQTGTSGTLTVTDTAMHTANLTLLGTYPTANFTLSSDGAGGTTVKDPAVVASATTLASQDA
jgi:autotransporter passenger strand-loop-strand repeat protein